MSEQVRKVRQQQHRLTKQERRDVLKMLKNASLENNINAALALSNFEMVEVTRESLARGADHVAT